MTSLSQHLPEQAQENPAPNYPLIHIIRHGQSLHNVDRSYSYMDPPLTPLGEEGAKSVATIAVPDLIVISPMTRAILTAMIAFPNLLGSMKPQVEVQIWPELREAHDAICNKGVSQSEISRKFPQFDFSNCSEEWDYPETTIQNATERAEVVRKLLGELSKSYSNIVVVSHRGLLAFLVQGKRFGLCEHRVYRFAGQEEANDQRMGIHCENQQVQDFGATLLLPYTGKAEFEIVPQGTATTEQQIVNLITATNAKCLSLIFTLKRTSPTRQVRPHTITHFLLQLINETTCDQPNKLSTFNLPIHLTAMKMRIRHRDNFFRAMREDRGQAHTNRFPIERTWDMSSVALAERFLFDKYREGIHPDCIEWEVREELATTPQGTYKYHYLRYVLDMQATLRTAGSFRGLPSMVELNAVERIVDKRIVLEGLIRDRFMRQNMNSMVPGIMDNKRGFDGDFTPGRHRALDYQEADDNDNIRRSVADLGFRLENAEARLDTQSQRSMSRRGESLAPSQASSSHRGDSFDYPRATHSNRNRAPMSPPSQMCDGSTRSVRSLSHRGGNERVIDSVGRHGVGAHLGGRNLESESGSRYGGGHGPNSQQFARREEDTRSQRHGHVGGGARSDSGGRNSERGDGMGGIRARGSDSHRSSRGGNDNGGGRGLNSQRSVRGGNGDRGVAAHGSQPSIRGGNDDRGRGQMVVYGGSRSSVGGRDDRSNNGNGGHGQQPQDGVARDQSRYGGVGGRPRR